MRSPGGRSPRCTLSSEWKQRRAAPPKTSTSPDCSRTTCGLGAPGGARSGCVSQKAKSAASPTETDTTGEPVRSRSADSELSWWYASLPVAE
ncbi:hypothetical protein T492DRAFT_517410 [Pavlovales sp. CCMP2436]|nr:hypothetical protein T492DRAFT_517410 [Pavlovales sp. CCMP2436]